ncbi:GntR family transcriptional regulator [Undibacterium terreum]|uniref:GntR family transcriptional regulator n=1 Tax=Undibacterium terreum TaxID=1224302 RepID=A0A916UBM5_9BURK|nr:GntR family transcriptional regulator [Undibacterium terreum]GGC67496.1 GntR family transcriptional regulator [Undibacterium terreum]
MNKHPPTLFSISTGSAEPIYRQLVDQVRRLVIGGQMLAGDSLPSVRDVAQELALNPMTVSKAYSMLEAEGILLRHRGLGMLVADGHNTAGGNITERARLLLPTLERAAAEARQLELDTKTVLALFKKILEEKQ